MGKKVVRTNLPDLERADDLERIISHLDTLYERGEDCLHPDNGSITTDGEYDALRRELQSLRPDSQLFDTATASLVESEVRKIVHDPRSEEHTSELQSRRNLVCRLLLEKQKKYNEKKINTMET